MSIRVDEKIIDLIKKKPEDQKSPFLSLEYFPPRTDDGVKNLYSRMERMKETVRPLFTDVTWGAGGSTATLSLEIAQKAHDMGHVANLHMTCTNMAGVDDPKEAVKDALQQALDGGIRNIVALRGDPPAGQDEWKAAAGGFTCALDLVRFIREEFGNVFGIAVAGYPEGHPNAITRIDDPTTMTESEQKRASVLDNVTYTCKDADYQSELDYLKQKVDAGSDLIITQMFFDVEVFLQFVKDCRAHGIDVPVVPGLMCINAYGGFAKMTKFCKTRVPPALAAKMASLSNSSGDEVKAFGVEYGVEMVQALVEGGVEVLHFYTLNLEKVVYGILDGVGLREATESNEKDASSMVAVGSAWARVGDTVKTLYGTGTVTEMRADATAVVRLESWLLAGEQNPIAYLAKGQYQKVF